MPLDYYRPGQRGSIETFVHHKNSAFVENAADHSEKVSIIERDIVFHIGIIDFFKSWGFMNAIQERVNVSLNGVSIKLF